MLLKELYLHHSYLKLYCMNSTENPEFLLNSKLLTVCGGCGLWNLGITNMLFFSLTFNIDICIRKQGDGTWRCRQLLQFC